MSMKRETIEGDVHIPSVMIALVAAFTLNSSAQNLMTLMNGHFSGTLTLLFFMLSVMLIIFFSD